MVNEVHFGVDDHVVLHEGAEGSMQLFFKPIAGYLQLIDEDGIDWNAWEIDGC